MVEGLRDRYDPAAPEGVPAHITVLYPFKAPETIDPTDINDLKGIFGGVGPFSFALTSVAQFPDVMYLVPEPSEPFARLGPDPRHYLCFAAQRLVV